MEGIKSLYGAIKKDKSIKILNLSNTMMGKEGVKIISKLLLDNKTLESIDISSNDLGLEGIKSISEVLKNNSTIKTLNVSNNHLYLEGIRFLSESLRSNNTITDLNISYNNIGEEGMKNISRLLKNNRNFHKIDISSNNLGLKYICSFIRKNNVISHIAIDLRDYERHDLIEALKFNNSIVSISFKNNHDLYKIPKFKEQVDDLLERNKNIKKIKILIFLFKNSKETLFSLVPKMVIVNHILVYL